MSKGRYETEATESGTILFVKQSDDYTGKRCMWKVSICSGRLPKTEKNLGNFRLGKLKEFGHNDFWAWTPAIFGLRECFRKSTS